MAKAQAVYGLTETIRELNKIEPGLRKQFTKDAERVAAPALDAALAALGSTPHTPLARYDDHATDAIITAAWLRRSAHDPALWSPAGLTPTIAVTEGWTFGVASA